MLRVEFKQKRALVVMYSDLHIGELFSVVRELDKLVTGGVYMKCSCKKVVVLKSYGSGSDPGMLTEFSDHTPVIRLNGVLEVEEM
jgi:hypothetical protein